MRVNHWIFIDKLKRKLFIKSELKKKILKSILKNNQIANIHKYYASYRKSKLIRWSNVNQQINRCFISGRPWYVNRLTRQTRFVFRRESYSGNLPGFRRASW